MNHKPYRYYMLKNISQLEFVAGGKIYHFNCDSDAPLPNVKEALNKFIHFVCQIEDNVAAAQKEAEEKAKAEQPQVETSENIVPIEA